MATAACVSHFPALEALDLRAPCGLARQPLAAVSALAALSSLTHLDLSGRAVADGDLRPLAALTALRVLCLAHTCTQPPLRLHFLRRLARLERLDLSGATIAAEAGEAASAPLAPLHALPALTALALAGCRLPVFAAVAAAAAAPALHSLDVSGIPAVAPLAFLLRGSSSLCALRVTLPARAPLAAAAAAALKAVSALTRLDVTAPVATPAAPLLAAAAALSHLEALRLCGTSGHFCRKCDVAHLEALPRLRRLELVATGGAAAAVVPLACVARLTTLTHLTFHVRGHCRTAAAGAADAKRAAEDALNELDLRGRCNGGHTDACLAPPAAPGSNDGADGGDSDADLASLAARSAGSESAADSGGFDADLGACPAQACGRGRPHTAAAMDVDRLRGGGELADAGCPGLSSAAQDQCTAVAIDALAAVDGGAHGHSAADGTTAAAADGHRHRFANGGGADAGSVAVAAADAGGSSVAQVDGGVSDADLAAVAALPALAELSLQCSAEHFTGRGLAHLCPCSHLCSLSLLGCSALETRHFAELVRLTALTALRLSGRALDADSLRDAAASLVTLRVLDVELSSCSAASVRRCLAPLPVLSAVSVRVCASSSGCACGSFVSGCCREGSGVGRKTSQSSGDAERLWGLTRKGSGGLSRSCSEVLGCWGDAGADFWGVDKGVVG